MMKRSSLILASAGGVAVLAVTGVALGVTVADETGGRATGTALTAATPSPTPDDGPTMDDSSTPDDSPTTDDSPGSDDDRTAGATPTDTGSATAVPSTGPSGGATAGGGEVSRERAGEIALATSGGGRIIEIEAEQEHRRPVWSVEIVDGTTEYEVAVDRDSGDVVKAEQEPVDDGDHRDDDRSGPDDRGDDHNDDHRDD